MNTINEMCDTIKKEFNDKNNFIEKLKTENEQLKSEHYKDEELQRLKKENEKLRRANLRGFPISEEENKKIAEWISEHEAKKHRLPPGTIRGGAIGGTYTYEFIPTSIGTFGTIKCYCGEKFEFTEDI